MTRASATAHPGDGSGMMERPDDSLGEINQLMALSGERFVASSAELFNTLARCGTAGNAAMETSAWLQKRLVEVTEQNQLLFMAWMRLALDGWRAFTPAFRAVTDGDARAEPAVTPPAETSAEPVPRQAVPERAAA